MVELKSKPNRPKIKANTGDNKERTLKTSYSSISKVNLRIMLDLNQ